MKTWIVEVCVPTKAPFWIGNVEAIDRTQAKRKCRNFVAQHLPLDTKIVHISEGRIDIHFTGEKFTMDGEPA